MNVPPNLSSADVMPDQILIDLIDDIAKKVQAGEPLDVEAYLQAHPGHADRLRRLLPAVEVLADLGRSASAGEASIPPGGSDVDPEQGRLGDFRIVREVGRGGMGVVYEAEQISLGRRVALKVLPFAGALDAKHLQRFKQEAQAAAHLQHQNIVPVHFVGCERGVHFYAMQFIDGQTLSAVIRDMRLLAGPQSSGAAVGGLASELASRGVSGEWLVVSGKVPPPPTPDDSPLTTHHSPLTPETIAAATLSTERSAKSPAFFRTAAHLAVQAAEALEHAHQLGVVHRDIKPANLLIQSDPGMSAPGIRLWVTDFGLARLGTDPGLTMTGDLLGTIRYMSPEQALANRVPIDHRTDIYSLGATLYELLTLKPAYNGKSREEVLRQIAFEEPRPPRRLNKSVPAELETIVLKAMGKNPEERYATAQELADDLKRFLDDKPIRAKRPTLLQRARKWVRRHQPVVWSAGVSAILVLLLAVAALAVSNVRIGREKQQKEAALQEMEKVLERERLNSYYQRIALAEQEWSANNLLRMQQLLDDCPEDLRGWEWHYLRRLRYRSPPILRHEAGVSDAAFSRDGQHVASVDRDGVVKVWDIQTGREVLGIQAHANRVAFSPDGHYLATGSGDRTIKIWDVDTRQSIRILQGHKDPITSVAFSPDGRRLASASGGGRDGPDRTVKVWDVATGQALLTLEGHLKPVRQVAFSPDGRRLASASGDQTVKLWDSETGQELRTFRGHTLAVNGVAFSPDGQRLASVAGDYAKRGAGEAKVWDVQTREEVLTLRGHTTLVLGVAFSPDGRRLATSGYDKNVKLWDATNGREILTLRGLRLYGMNPRVAFSPDGTRLVCAGRDHTVRVWDATPLGDAVGEEVLTLRGHQAGVRSVAFCPDGKCLATAGEDDVVRIWDLPSGRELHRLHGQSGMMVHLAFSRQGKYLALGGKELTVWDTITWKKVWTRPTGSDAVAFGPDEGLLASGSPNPNPLVRVWDVATGQEKRTLRDHNWGILGLAFSPDGKVLASASGDSSVRLWDLETGDEIKTPPMRHVGASRGVAFSPDGLYLASPGMDPTVKIWDTATWREWRTLRDLTNGILSVAWSPDGRRLAWGGTDATVKIADPATGKILRTLRGHIGWVEGVAFSPDGQWIASASLDGTVKLWPTRTPPEAEDPDP
jgi:WD40 repeat protein/serine/threonine protein kinase